MERIASITQSIANIANGLKITTTTFKEVVLTDRNNKVASHYYKVEEVSKLLYNQSGKLEPELTPKKIDITV